MIHDTCININIYASKHFVCVNNLQICKVCKFFTYVQAKICMCRQMYKHVNM